MSRIFRENIKVYKLVNFSRNDISFDNVKLQMTIEYRAFYRQSFSSSEIDGV